MSGKAHVRRDKLGVKVTESRGEIYSMAACSASACQPCAHAKTPTVCRSSQVEALSQPVAG